MSDTSYFLLAQSVKTQNASIQKEIDRIKNEGTMYSQKTNYKSADRYYLKYVAFLFVMLYVLMFLLFSFVVGISTRLSVGIKIGYIAAAALYPLYIGYILVLVKFAAVWGFSGIAATFYRPE